MKRLMILLIIFITAPVFLQACGFGRWVRTPVIEEPFVTVNLEHRLENKQIIDQGYNHPYDINSQDLTALFRDIVYNEKSGIFGNKKEVPVFQDVETARLVPVIVNTLAKADSSQRIQFTSLNKGGGFLLKSTRRTEGIIFIKPEGHLNIAFNLINYEKMMADSHELPDNIPQDDPLTIKIANTTLVPDSAYAKLHSLEKEKPAPMWLVAELGKLHETVKEKSEMEAAVIEDVEQLVEAVQESQKAESVESIPEKKAERETSETEKTDTKTSSPMAEDSVETEVKERLVYLKGLFDSGLISEEEYKAEKKELLEKLN